MSKPWVSPELREQMAAREREDVYRPPVPLLTHALLGLATEETMLDTEDDGWEDDEPIVRAPSVERTPSTWNTVSDWAGEEEV